MTAHRTAKYQELEPKFRKPSSTLVFLLLYYSTVPYCLFMHSKLFQILAKPFSRLCSLQSAIHDIMVDIIPIYQFMVLTLLPSYHILRGWDILILRHRQLVLVKYSGKRTWAQIFILTVLLCFGYLGLNFIIMIPYTSQDSL